MDIIYLDTLFFINCITDYLTLLCSGKICGAVLHRLRLVGAAILGGLYACGCVLPGAVWLTHPLVKIAVGMTMCLIAFGSEEKLVRCCVTFLAVSAGFGGVVSALALNGNGVFYVPINLKVLLLTFAVVYFVLSTSYRCMARNRSRAYHRITIDFQGATVRFTALRDTGNELFDPISNAPILICEQALLTPLFPDFDLTACQSDPYGLFSAMSQARYAGKLRLIPYQSIGGNGVLWGFKPDCIRIDDTPQELIVAATQRQLSHDNTYQGIF